MSMKINILENCLSKLVYISVMPEKPGNYEYPYPFGRRIVWETTIFDFQDTILT